MWRRRHGGEEAEHAIKMMRSDVEGTGAVIMRHRRLDKDAGRDVTPVTQPRYWSVAVILCLCEGACQKS